MPGLRLYKKGFYSNIGANNHISLGTINLGSTRGLGSSIRMYNYCRSHTENQSECINQFINITDIRYFVDISIYFPPVVSQGDTDACQSYASTYYIGNYYNMLINNNLNFYNLKPNSLNFDSYYNDSNNIINPLYVWTYENGDSAGPNTKKISDYYDIAKNGLKTYDNFNLFFDPPNVVGNTLVDYPPTIENNLYSYPFSQINNYNLIYKRSDYITFLNTFSLQYIKNILNQKIPIFWNISLNTYFRQHFDKIYNPIVSSYYDNSTTPVTFNSPLGIWYATSTTDPNVVNSVIGHSMVICGYIDNVPQAFQADGSSGVFIFRNQWGKDFGNEGNCYITYNYFFNGLGINVNGKQSTYNPISLSDGSSPTDELIVFPIN